MEPFNLQSYLDPIYGSFPEAVTQPVIGITANYGDGSAKILDPYYKQVVAAGATPVLIPPVADKDVIINTLQRIDGLILTGGGDINPLWCGEEPEPALGGINGERDLAELLTVRLAYNRQIPMLGICRGIQTLVVALGGKVAQDINAHAGESHIKHSQDSERSLPSHSVTYEVGSVLGDIYGTSGKLYVNSFHHQAVSEAGPRFHVIAKAPDGVIEAIESSEHKALLGVQWHPEWLGESGRKLFEWLRQRAEEFRQAKALHQRILTLDTHCDTPMFFPQGVDFGKRDPRILVDLHKMDDGRQDAVTMVAYLPQPHEGQTFHDVSPYPEIDNPKDYADLIFDKIEDILKAHPDHIRQARTPEELYENKRQGLKSIMFGIENGLALDHNLDNIDYFARRGVVYITLCHNGDNDICDSCRGNHTHNGMSPFGERVINRMNDCGLMVDLSHAGEKSFYDALDISRTPIVCSHSDCKALCDVPRNLTDDQLRALAAKGGVVHTTIYDGFLRQGGGASVLDAVAHLEHTIHVMGIEHVGIGTDFDGDGGVPGMADSSELINFTMHLLRRHYSEDDLRLIWGGNWLRVMSQVQQAKNTSNND